MKTTFCAAAVLCVALTAADAGALETPAAAFAKQPVASRDGDRVRIEFELNGMTDVAIYILDGDNRVVRHLAAGVLGENAPEPFRKNASAQSVVWDGKDDAGRPATGGPFKARVAAGIRAAYGGTAFGSKEGGDDLTNVVGMSVDREGRVYVMSVRWNRIHWRHTAIHVYNRDGSYFRTIKPFPAGIAADKVKAVTPLAYEDGKPLPVIHRILAMSYYPNEDMPCQMAITPDDTLHFLVSRAAYRKLEDKHLASIALDGGVPFQSLAGPMLPSETTAGRLFLVASSDGKRIFATGIERGNAVEGTRYRPNRPCVYRIGLPERNVDGILFGDPKTPGSDRAHLNDPQGLAVDGKGRLLVADRGNNRVAILNEADGRFLGAFDVPAPTWIGAHRKTGAVYVASKDDVIKFVLGADLKAVEQGRISLQPPTGKVSAADRVLALDDSRTEAVLWLGMSRGGTALMRCTERDGTFGAFERAAYREAQIYWNLFPSLGRDKVGCRVGNTVRVLDETTGQTRDIRLPGSSGQTYRMGPNDEFYGMDHWRWGVRRWDRDGKFMPFEDSKDDKEFKGRLWNRPNGTTAWERDFEVDRAGNVYVVHNGLVYHGRKSIEKYDRLGKPLGTKIWVVSDGCLGPRLDNRGNIYIAEAVRPAGMEVPEFFRGRLPEGLIDKRGSALQQYRWMYGSILKFGPEGGAVLFPVLDPKRDAYRFDVKDIPAGFARMKVDTSQGDRVAVKPGEVAGALWMRYGVSYVLDMHPSHNRRCHCTATEFEVDDFGRSYYTDQGRFRVAIMDTAGNEIVTFGRYGNQDTEGPDIGFNWFAGLAFTENSVYVADGGNRRVVRVKLTHTADVTMPVP
jgi:hypothetical protein